MRLFCFTFAGGSASFFNELERCVGPNVDVVKLEYPGHGMRMKEALCQSFDELVADVYPTLEEKSRDGEPYALLGYSMGSIAAVETLRAILARGRIAPPRRVFLAAHEPRTNAQLLGVTGEEGDSIIMERTKGFGGIPPKLLGNRSFWRLYLPVYRADYTMLARYDFERIGLRTQIPLTAFYSQTDTPLERMLEWKRCFTGEAEFFRFEGNHFFISEHCREMADIITERLTRHDV